MAGCTHADDGAFGPGASRGVTPPLLPTLMMAAILGGASYLCHEPAPVAVPAPVPATAVAAAPEAVVEAPFIPAPLAFQTQFPMIVVAQAEAAPAAQVHRASARLTAPRRVEARRVAAKNPEVKGTDLKRLDGKVFDRAAPGPDRALPFAADAEEGRTVAASDEGVLPEIALPFAPTIRAVTQASVAAGAFVGAKGMALGAQTATLGAAVSGWVGRLR